VERRLAAILAADVVGYSRLMGGDEVGTLTSLKAHLKDLIQPKIAGHSGRVVKLMGDGVLAEFASVVEAVQCAVEIQQAMAERNRDLPQERRIDFRVGVNLGDVIVEGEDLFGDGVNVAARLEGLAQPGGVCVSRAVRDQIRDKLPLRLDDLGEVRVKNIARPVRAFHVSVGAESLTASVAAPTAAAGAVTDIPTQPAIAVLPFANLSQDPEQDYFADGITEDISTELSRLPSLFVIARNSAFAYKGKKATVEQVGRELKVGYVVEGSVRKAGNRVRITVELADAVAGKQLWAERFDRELEDVFAIQDEVTRRIVAVLPARLEAADLERARHKPPETMAAYDYLLRGKNHHHRGTKEDNAEALRLLAKAVELDPSYGQAFAWQACTFGQALVRGFAADKNEAWNGCVTAAERSRSLDDEDSECHRVLSDVHAIQGNLDQAWAHHEKAFALNPNDPRIVSQRGELLTWLGRPEEGVQMIETAMQLDPLASDGRVGNLGVALHSAERYVDALAAFKRVPNKSFGHHVYLAACYARLGQDEDAQAETEAVLKAKPDFTVTAYLETIPYRDQEQRLRHKIDLCKAGLPE
jgi:adenylate cyclase